MPDNLFSGPQAGVNHALALLRASAGERAPQPDALLVPGILWSTDPAIEVKGRITLGQGALMALALEPQGPTKWMSLNLDLGAIDLRAFQWLGILCSVQAPRATTFRVMLRSTIDGGVVDSYFRKTVVGFAEATTHMDALDVTRDPTVPRAATKRELILLLDNQPQDLTLHNLAVFVA